MQLVQLIGYSMDHANVVRVVQVPVERWMIIQVIMFLNVSHFLIHTHTLQKSTVESSVVE